MENFTINRYLQNLDTVKRTGTCIACQKTVQWAKDRVAAHKRTSCPNASEDEKRLFAKRKAESSINFNNDIIISAETYEVVDNVMNPEESKKEIDMKLANFFFRTGISLRLVESEAFKDLSKARNPSYASSIPCAKTLSGSLLDKKYAECSSKLEENLESSGNLTLVSDGWTNIGGDHIVNFCNKAPNTKPFFYTSINTSGIIQNAAAVAGDIIEVIETLGQQKFRSIITDNAPVMKAAWKLIEEKFPHISTWLCSTRYESSR